MQKNLNDYIGCACEVYTDDNDLLAIGRISNVRTEPCLTVEIASSDGGEMPYVKNETHIKISIINTKQGFLGLFGRVYITNSDFWRVDEVRCLGEHERRGFFRIKNHSPATVHAVGNEENTYAGMVTNVSLSGILVHIDKDEQLYELGSEVVVSGFTVGEISELFTVNCKVRRIAQHPKSGKFYGCQYERLESKLSDRLCQAIFAQQRIEIKRRRGII